MKLFTLISFILLTSSPLVYAQDTNLPENSSLVKAGSKFVTLLGTQINVGDIAPNFKVVDENFSPVTFERYSGKNVLISVVPSLDTGVCSAQTKTFNEKVASLSDKTVFITISNDLPFAQKRFCNTENINNIQILSDSVWRDFGAKYGLLIKDMGLLTRAIFIINPEQKVVYKELVANISTPPNYETALEKITLLSSQTSE
ncbi:thiol peroxidase [Pseudocolwellia sp. AS88]|uniref:thiol peroxidase n=1 Tax=Pseudocolwellia sp. AS88 TaxID=3063958 RepID=UPI0026F363EF|nr:thiol peroxidase [Pseudocolwellia sp. AS88]MDO7086433.1 thiol peroxidase [Pseudocolwellia sp. AS88]